MQFTDRDSSDWGFQMVPEGRHLFVWEDNIRTHQPEDSSKKPSIIFPAKVIGPDKEKCPEGEGEGATINVFAGLDGSKFSKRKFGDIIVLSGLKEVFEKQFPGDIEPDDPKAVDALKAKLPGKKIILTIAHQKDKQGREQANVVKIEKFVPDKEKQQKKGQAAAAAASAAPATSPNAAPEGDGW